MDGAIFNTFTFSSCSSKTPLDSNRARRRARGSRDDSRLPVFKDKPRDVNFFTRDALSPDLAGAVAGAEDEEEDVGGISWDR